MPGKTPHTNGDKAVDNRVNGTKDVEMKDDAPLKTAKSKKVKEGDEEMTVVVPPSKASILSGGGPHKKDLEGDVEMEVDVNGAESEEEKVDPVLKAVASTCSFSSA